MNKSRTIKQDDLSQEEQRIVQLLNERNECLYGDIFKELNLSQLKGAEAVLSLTNKGLISNVGKSSYYRLNGVLQE